MIVVGVDGSEPARRALAFAAEEAKLRDLPLRIVCAWEIPPVDYVGAALLPTPDAADAAERHARDVLADALAELGNLGVAVEALEVHGHPPDVLVEQARDATLLVVGSRGHGGLASLVLGSVSQAVAHRCHCPLTIVPAR